MTPRPEPYHDPDLARVFEQHATDSPFNAHYDRPAVLELLGDVADLDVLDAACGPGLYAEILAEAGARVTGFDGSEAMVELTRARLGDRARVLRADLGDRLPLDDETFDRVVCALAIHYATDRHAAFAEMYRLLRAGGTAVVSTGHPMTDWLRMGGRYFETSLESENWSEPFGDHEFAFWREPLGALTDAAHGAGFLISRIVEPLPTAVVAERWPAIHEELMATPFFIVFGLVKPG